MRTSNKLKQQAVRATFAHLLDEEQLHQLISTLEIDYSGDYTDSLISYVKYVVKKFGIDQNQLKNLYASLYAYLNTPGIEFPEDSATQGISDQPVSDQSLQSIEVFDVDRSSPTQTEEIKTEKIDIEDNTPEMTVFSHFIQRLLFHYTLDRMEFLREAALLVHKEKLFSKQDKEQITEWSQDPDAFRWSFVPEEKVMSVFVHLSYTILCDFLGPIDADKLFHQVLNDCKQIPAAKKYNPRNFL